MPSSAPAPDKRTLLRVHSAGLLGLGMFDIFVFLVPLWAVLTGANATEVGILVGARSLLPGLFTIHGGVLMDRFGPRGVMTVFIVLIMTLAPLYSVLPHFVPLLALQLVLGLAMTLQWVGAQTMIAQLSKGDTGYLGHFTFASRIGTFIAPLIFGLLWDLTTPRASFIAASVWAAVLLALILSIPTPPETRAKAPSRLRLGDLVPRLSDYRDTLALLAIPAIAITIAACFLRNSTTGMQGSIYIVYLQDIGLTGTLIGLLFSAIEAASGVGALIAGRVTRRFAPMTTLVTVTGIAIALMAITPLLGGVIALLMVAQVFRGLAQGIHQPVTFSIQSLAVPPDRQGSAIALRVTTNRVSALTIPPTMGLIADTWGIGPSFLILGAILVALVIVLWLVAKRHGAPAEP